MSNTQSSSTDKVVEVERASHHEQWSAAKSVVFIVITALLLFTLLAGCQQVQRVRIGTAIHKSCQEDMPCWDCHTMGNHICGTPRLCTAQNSEAPCVANGDNEPTCRKEEFNIHTGQCEFTNEGSK